MKHLLFLIALAVSAQQIKINPITGLPDLVGSGGGGGAVSSVTAGPLGAITVSPTTGATVVDVDPAYVPNKAGTETIIGDWTFYDSTAVTGSTLVVVRAGAGQSGDIQAWRNNAGTTVARITKDGYASFGGSSGMELRGDTSQLYVTDVGTSRNIFSFRDYLSLGVSSDTLIGWSNTTNATSTLDIGVGRCGAGCLEVNNGTAGTLRDLIQRHPLAGGTSPTIASGFGTTPSIAGKDAAGRVTVGSGGTAATGTITFGTAWATAPVCTAANETTQLALFPTATTTTLTLASTTPFTAADKLVYQCIGY